MRKVMTYITILALSAIGAFADDPTNFSEALPATLIPDGFWKAVGIGFTALAALWGVKRVMGLFKRA